MCGDPVGVRRRSVTEGHARRDARNVGDKARAYGHRGFPESPRRNLDTRSVAVTENAAFRISACTPINAVVFSDCWFCPREAPSSEWAVETLEPVPVTGLQ